MRTLLSYCFILVLLKLNSQAQTRIPAVQLPDSIYSGKQGKFHMQGLAVDQVRGFVYFSFTDRLVKTDLQGNLIGSVTGFVGHLGDLDIAADGKIYSSLEYKNDAIGKNIRAAMAVESQPKNGFYIAIFEGAAITRPNMDAEKEDLLRTIYLREVVKDYEASVKNGAETLPHRFACSGIDGLAFAPAPGSADRQKTFLYVAYGVYGDTTRADNNHQVLLQYDISNWNRYDQQLSQNHLHHSGPSKPLGKYFVKTGSSRYGIQNLAYDTHTGNLFAAVYRGAKSKFPNYDLFAIDIRQKPAQAEITSGDKKIRVKTLSLLETAPRDSATGVSGWYFNWGSTGLCPLGEGFFYLSHPSKDKEGREQSTIYKYKWVGEKTMPFAR